LKKATGGTSLNIYPKIAVAITSVILTSCVLQASQTQAASFEFGYKFLSGNTLSGTVEGDLQPEGDVINNLTSLRAFYSGVPDQTFSFLLFSDSSLNRISFSGTTNNFYGFVNPLPTTNQVVNNFGFALLDDGATNSATVGFFEASQFGVSFPFNSKQLEAETFSPERWTLTQRTTQPVPEPNTILGLAIFSFISFFAKKRLYRRVE
jgi:hypothetical protein